MSGRDLSKLPKWAQDEIKRLSADVESLRATIVARGTAEAAAVGCVVINPYDDAAAVTFRPRTTARFIVGGGPSDYIDLSWREGYLHVHATDLIAVLPGASNTVRIAPHDPPAAARPTPTEAR